ncbi:Vegetative incompatibility protein HET-E-1 [Colletotrichum aenigma]|uniref:Vegetative incompatibility protein HET-E-1 n=1 Tax=Colletotrichum aenigma TaxID=1215731 RepID=UPI001872C4B1|nr:Vegetative incompatibility protein HET-E-1 [Colletotrichum aenigma]KAF5528527.1 Vegetative incompatibility protein HET-E-1 [Colletotrichum aenigma]
MRLINTQTLELEDFPSNDLVPPYAILFHTWGDGEVTFHDWQDDEERAKKKGFHKIQSTCRRAVQDDYSHAWVDTNCIDKSSSAELSEAINSMFAWYENAAVCYVYMPDVIQLPTKGYGTHFQESRWFTRGWTLQELIAPRNIVFYGRDWEMLGTKTGLVTTISKRITKIPRGCLLNEQPLSSFSTAQIMSWASSRVTTRPEDQACCLLGLFGVNMPLLYGEGSKAFVRLQEEIIKISDDQSIFACDMEALAMKALEERTSMMAMVGKSDADEFGRGLLIFKKKGSGRESGKYVAVYFEAGLDENLPLEERFYGWRRRCRVFPDWNVHHTLKDVKPFSDEFLGERGRASWVGDFLVTARTMLPVDSPHMPGTSTVLVAEIIFDMNRFRDMRGRKGSMSETNDSPQYSMMLRDSEGSDIEL